MFIAFQRNVIFFQHSKNIQFRSACKHDSISKMNVINRQRDFDRCIVAELFAHWCRQWKLTRSSSDAVDDGVAFNELHLNDFLNDWQTHNFDCLNVSRSCFLCVCVCLRTSEYHIKHVQQWNDCDAMSNGNISGNIRSSWHFHLMWILTFIMVITSVCAVYIFGFG